MLVAEDDGLLRNIIVHQLNADGIAAQGFGNGQELSNYLEECYTAGRDRLPSLIVADVRLPGRSGLEIASLIRSLDGSIPIILMTAFPPACSRVESDDLGISAIFYKPFDVDDLRTAVWNLVP